MHIFSMWYTLCLSKENTEQKEFIIHPVFHITYGTVLSVHPLGEKRALILEIRTDPLYLSNKIEPTHIYIFLWI